jgi:Na+/H+ antiporter NhaD/arsenite permease-like protein
VAAALVFAGTYLVLAFGRIPFLRIDRTGAAIVGAVLMVALRIVSLDEAYRAIDYRTIVLLFGMMILVANLRLARTFDRLAAVTVSRVAHPVVLLVVVVFVSGALSALFVNDTICLVFTPVLIEMARARGRNPVPYLIGLATGSNIGSVATIVGNPQNMLIASMSRIGYVEFARVLGPVALGGLAIDAAILCTVYRRDLHGRSVSARPLVTRPIHRAMTVKSLIVAAAALAGFVVGWEPALVAVSAAAVLLVSRNIKPSKLYRAVDWDLLALFIGLFVVIAGVENAGLDRWFFERLRPVGIATLGGLSIVGAVLSNAISNVPAVMLFTSLVPALPSPRLSWFALAMSTTLAGNLTILGSVANLIVVEGARRSGVRITFAQHLAVGVPVTCATLLFGVLWLHMFAR